MNAYEIISFTSRIPVRNSVIIMWLLLDNYYIPNKLVNAHFMVYDSGS